MIIPMENISQILMVLALATAAIIIMKRDIRSLIKTYALQSLFIAVLAVVFYIETGVITLLLLAILFVVSKVVIIPYFMGKVQQKLNIKRDVKFHFLSPIAALIVSIFIILFVYLAFTPLIADLNRFDSTLFTLGATAGVSLVFMGMIVVFTRKQTLTDVVGYLTMENGVILFSLFLTELPLLIEILIIIDLIMLTLIATVMAFGIDSTIEEFHARLNPFAPKESAKKKPEEETTQ